ncbi:MAG TPA: tetratricopeptide repeat protein [Bryobacterales bacterium]|nr:tetratricopeptide repeat protein [Bryobacterales bacterium]
MLWPLLVILAIQAASSGRAAAPPQALDAAAAALEAGKYAEAAELLEKAVAADPKDYRARFNLAFAYTQLHRETEAIAQYTKVVEQQPDLAPARLNLGILLLRQEKASAAVPHLELAAEKRLQDFRAQFYLGEALLKAGLSGRAAAAYQRALAIDPKSAAAVLGLARSFARQGQIDSAREQYLRAAQMDRQFNDALLELGDLLEGRKQPDEALGLYLEYLKTKPEAVAVQERAGVLLLQSKRYPEAIEHLEAAVRQNPTAANQTALAQAYTMSRQPAKAVPLLRAAVIAEPDDLDLHLRLAMALLETMDYGGASKEFAAVAQKQPSNVDAWNGLGFTLYKVENYDGALQALERARQLGSEPPGNEFLRAIILDRFHQYPAALESYQKFLAASGGKDPDDEFKARQRVRIITNMLNKRR